MKITKRIDDFYRLLIPKEMRDAMNMPKKAKVDLTLTDTNDILIHMIPDEINLMEEKEEIKIPPLEERLSSRLVDHTLDKSEKCYKCGSELEPGNRLKINR